MTDTEDYSIIKNPFVCKTSAPIRIGVPNDKDKKKVIFTTSNTNGNKYFYNEKDPKLNYVFGTSEEKEMTEIDKYDYTISADILNKNSKVEHKEPLPISFLQIKTEAEGIEWYKKHYPKIPDDLLPIIARYHWGEPITKKGLKNEKKKLTKKINKGGGKTLQQRIEDGEDIFKINFNN
tara:strand:- start:1771 stop:2304 length:534 start_codon:yes stop_codon:yes gene_type:complete